ncbi:MAG TPA: M48 family metallopeptidase [Gemmatimonadaceae bacterium]|jgi:predicted Zn-dependent protease
MKRIVILVATIALAGCAVSQQQEIQMGQQYAAQISQQLPLINDPEVVRYINVLGDSIANVTSRRDLDWHFYVVNSSEVNAFAVPGGYVYVNRGLIERATSMDELAGVLGHEIGHVVRRHSVKQMQKEQGANIGITLACVLTSVCNNQAAGTVVNVGASAIFAKFSRGDEAQADEEGFKNVVRAGVSPEGLVTMFQKLIDERKATPGAVDAWFATHPLEEDRIADVQRLINTLTPAQLAGLTKDSKNFHTFKSRLATLPPPPPTRGQ